MSDIIKFDTSPARVLAAALDLAENHALYQKRTISHSRLNASKLLTIQFGQHDRRFVTVKILLTQEGVNRLCGIEANLPAILHGHNGRLIKSQEDMILALTLVRNLVKFLVHPDDHDLILPGREQGNNGYIRAVEFPLQLQDPAHELLLAAHFTSCRHFQKPSQIFPGESICHRSSGLDLEFYDKQKESKDGRVIPSDKGCTRIEVRFRNPRRLSEAVGLEDSGDHVIATIPFADLYYAFRQVIRRSLIGALADAPGAPPKHLRPAARTILRLAGDSVGLWAVLAEQQKMMTPREYGRIRRQVFHELARLHPVSLLELIESWPTDLISEIEIPTLERAHKAMMSTLGWQSEPDDDIADSFSGLLLLRKDNPAMRKWVGPGGHPF